MMARFNEIHRREMNTASENLRDRDRWQILVREPMTLAALNAMGDPAASAVRVVSFVLFRDVLVPASEVDRAIIADWNERHAHTPYSDFGLEWSCR